VIQRFSAEGRSKQLNLVTESGANKGTYPMDTEREVVTVLLVEDTEDNRQMMRRLLEMSGFRVVEALNGREAVEVAAEVKPKIILMDLSLPFVDGLAATRQIRKLPGLRDVPIVAVSAHDTADFHSQALDAGCNAYVTKPVHYPELEDLVNSLLNSQP
jgi:two-component system cell cycle response regulator DivK